MTLRELFTLTTMEHRHLLLAYGLVAIVQLGYLVSTLRGLFRRSADPELQDLHSGSVSRRS